MPRDCAITRAQKERALGQRARAIWFYGRPGAGKTTLASRLERKLATAGCKTAFLDGDSLRAGLNAGLGFNREDRAENLRRAAQVASLFVEAGLVTVCAFITPLAEHRAMVRAIVGIDDLVEVFVSAELATCAKRDPKGLYAQAAAHKISLFTGVDSQFEPPTSGEAPYVIDTERYSVGVCVSQLFSYIRPFVCRVANPRKLL